MKLLLDENLSRRIVPLLVTDFPGTMQVTLLGMERATDMEIQKHYWKEYLNHD
jgi:predicted nuclease of predicted toxin-antitoxin system